MDSEQTQATDATAQGQPTTAGTPLALKLHPQTLEAMHKAGLDPAKASAQEVVDFVTKGASEIHEGWQRDREARKAAETARKHAETELQGYRDLQLQTILGGVEIGAEGKAALSSLQSKAAKADGFLAILGLAKDEGLIPEQLFEAVQTGSPEAAKPVISLLKQLGLKAAEAAAARGKGVGSDISTAGATTPPPDGRMSIDTKDLFGKLKQQRTTSA
jgi:hypothetical protein